MVGRKRKFPSNYRPPSWVVHPSSDSESEMDGGPERSQPRVLMFGSQNVLNPIPNLYSHDITSTKASSQVPTNLQRSPTPSTSKSTSETNITAATSPSSQSTLSTASQCRQATPSSTSRSTITTTSDYPESHHSSFNNSSTDSFNILDTDTDTDCGDIPEPNTDDEVVAAAADDDDGDLLMLSESEVFSKHSICNHVIFFKNTFFSRKNMNRIAINHYFIRCPKNGFSMRMSIEFQKPQVIPFLSWEKNGFLLYLWQETWKESQRIRRSLFTYDVSSTTSMFQKYT